MNWMEYINAFWVGGAICAVCQVFIDKTKLTPARILVSLVVIGVFLQAIGIYQPVVDYAGAGATVPLLGFGYSLAKGVAKAVAEKGLLGVFTGGVTGAAGGIAAAIVSGALCALPQNPKTKMGDAGEGKKQRPVFSPRVSLSKKSLVRRAHQIEFCRKLQNS